MITTLTGKNSFDMSAAKQLAVEKFISEHGSMAVETYEGESAEPATVRDALSNLPFLVSKKLVVLDEPGKNKQLAEKLPDWLDDSDVIDVLIIEPSPDKRTVFYKFLQKSTTLKDFPLLAARDIQSWINRYASSKNTKLSPGAVRLLIERVGAPRDGVNPRQYAQEIDKLALFKENIEEPDVAELVEELPQNTVFDMLDSLVAGNAKRTQELYGKLTRQKIDPSEILAMIVWQVHMLMLIRSAGGSQSEAARKTKLHPFVVQKNWPLASRLPLSDMKKMVDLLLNAELSIKKNGLNADAVVSTLLVTLLYEIKKQT